MENSSNIKYQRTITTSPKQKDYGRRSFGYSVSSAKSGLNDTAEVMVIV
jgi:hypothetical protein